MGSILWLFNTTGYIFGPLILLCGLIALALCLWASRRASTARARRMALACALLPLAAGACGALVGLAVWKYFEQVPADPWVPWLALGKCCLAGLVVSLVPLLWALLLLRARPGAV